MSRSGVWIDRAIGGLAASLIVALILIVLSRLKLLYSAFRGRRNE
jgi:hypothetical protein